MLRGYFFYHMTGYKLGEYSMVNCEAAVSCVNHPPAFYRARWLVRATWRDAKTWQLKFPVGFPVKVCALNVLLFTIFTMLLLV